MELENINLGVISFTFVTLVNEHWLYLRLPKIYYWKALPE